MKRTEKLLVAAVAFSGLTLAAGQVAADTNAPTYSVTIPATVNLADSNPVATIKAEGVSIDTTRYTPISVKLAQASNTIKGSTFHLREAKTNDTLSYSIRKNRRNVSVGDTVARFTSDGETTLNFTKPEAADYAGSYTENLTFDISVSPNSNYVPVTSVSINSAPSTLNVGATGTLTATVGPEEATDKTVTWESSNPEVLAIDATTGAYEAKAGGTATVTVKAADGKTATCTVTVNTPYVPVTSVAIDNAPTNALGVGATGALTATVGPEGATDKTVTWASGNPDVLVIDATTGTYEAKAAGTATVTVTAADGKTATCTVTVNVPVTSVSINNAPSTLDVGATGTLTATVGPEGATDKTVTWASGNPDVLVIDATTGAYEAKAAGTATITATAGGQSATCQVTVDAPTPTMTTLADAFVNGSVINLNVKYGMVSHEVTLTNSNGEYVVNSELSYFKGAVQFGDTLTLTFGRPNDNRVDAKIIFYKAFDAYEIMNPSASLFAVSLNSISVNGVDITNQLYKSE